MSLEIDIYEFAEILSDCAANALYLELDTTPKPGLVDKRNSGSHSDMDYDTFCRSIEAIRPYFVKICIASYDCDDMETLAGRIRLLGINAERAMLKATGGVNTHKGAIFCLGLFLAALSQCEEMPLELDKVCEKVKELANIFDTFPSNPDSHGRQMARKYGIKTAMDYAKTGYYEVIIEPLLHYRFMLLSAETANQARVNTLIRFMAKLDDSNVYYRGGKEGAEYVKRRANELLKRFSILGAEELDDELISKNISCGGCADMLALTLFVNDLIGYVVEHS